MQYFSAHLAKARVPGSESLQLLRKTWIDASTRFDPSLVTLTRDLERARVAQRRVHAVAGDVACALALASIHERSKHIAPSLVAAAVRTSIWSEDRALASCQLMAASERAETLLAIAIASALRPDLVRYAWESALEARFAEPEPDDHRPVLATQFGRKATPSRHVIAQLGYVTLTSLVQDIIDIAGRDDALRLETLVAFADRSTTYATAAVERLAAVDGLDAVRWIQLLSRLATSGMRSRLIDRRVRSSTRIIDDKPSRRSRETVPQG